MEEGDEGAYGQFYNEPGVRMKDLEEKQRVLKDRVLLIGKNLIEIRETLSEGALEMKREVEEMKREVEKMKGFLETVSGDFSKFARKEDLEILSKQAKMFQPLEFIKKSNIKSKKK
jgi:hypothetical protein|tara:strand:+ start:1417 stop:1764 length:348 start_codon:yes stop_codon:yes gene_type:complete